MFGSTQAQRMKIIYYLLYILWCDDAELRLDIYFVLYSGILTLSPTYQRLFSKLFESLVCLFKPFLIRILFDIILYSILNYLFLYGKKFVNSVLSVKSDVFLIMIMAGQDWYLTFHLLACVPSSLTGLVVVTFTLTMIYVPLLYLSCNSECRHLQ